MISLAVSLSRRQGAWWFNKAGSLKLEAGSWKLEDESWKLEVGRRKQICPLFLPLQGAGAGANAEPDEKRQIKQEQYKIK